VEQAAQADEVHRISTPEPDGHPLDAMRRFRAVIDSPHRIPQSRNRNLDKDVDTPRSSSVIAAWRECECECACDGKGSACSHTDSRGDRGAVLALPMAPLYAVCTARSTYRGCDMETVES
jgi:hypothetical protein